MNLLAKSGTWWLMAIIFVFWSCQEDLGIEVDPGQGRTEGTSIELTLPVTNVFLDSLRTDKAGQILLGEYSDGVVGTITTESYFEYGFSRGIVNDEAFWIEQTVTTDDLVETFADSVDDLVFESATLRLRVLSALSSSESISKEIVVHTLSDSIFNEAIYMNDRSIPTDEEIGRGNVLVDGIGNFSYTEDTVVVSVDITSQVMSDLFDRLVDEGTGIEQLGLKISSELSNGLLSFLVTDDSTRLELKIRGNVYDTTGVATLKNDTTFTSSFNILPSKHFVNVTRDLAGSELDGISNYNELNTQDGFVHYMPLAGLYPVIDLEPFLEFAETEEQLIATLGNLEILVEANQETVPYIITTNFYFGNRDQNNVTVNWPSALTALGIYSTVLLADNSYIGSSAVPYEMTNDTLSTSPFSYGFNGDFTAFWQSMHRNVRYDIDGVDVDDRAFPASALMDVKNFVLHPPAPLSLGHSSIPSEGVKLKVFYTRIEN